METSRNESLEYLRALAIKKLKRIEQDRVNAIARLEALNHAINMEGERTVKVNQHDLFKGEPSGE